MLTFPAGTTAETVERVLSTQVAARNVSKGQFLRSTMLGKGRNLVVLRSKSDMHEGDRLSLDTIEAITFEGTPPGGAIIFDSEEEATLFVDRASDMTAKRMIYAAHILTINDTAGAP